MSKQDDKAQKMAKEAGVPLDNIYTEDDFAKSFGGENARWMTNDRWTEIANSQTMSDGALKALQDQYDEEDEKDKKACR